MATPTEFVEGLRGHVIRYQKCLDCNAAQTLVRHACTKCGSLRLLWRNSEGRGRVFAASVVHRAPSEDFRPLAPYTLVLVDLDEGARLMAHGVPGLAIGDRVAATFFEHGGRTLVRFRPEP